MWFNKTNAVKIFREWIRLYKSNSLFSLPKIYNMWLCAMWKVFEDHKTTFWNQSNKNEISGYRERQKDHIIIELCWHEILNEKKLRH